MQPKFPLGRIVGTPGALRALARTGQTGPGYRPKWRGVAAIGGRGNLR